MTHQQAGMDHELASKIAALITHGSCGEFRAGVVVRSDERSGFLYEVEAQSRREGYEEDVLVIEVAQIREAQ